MTPGVGDQRAGVLQQLRGAAQVEQLLSQQPPHLLARLPGTLLPLPPGAIEQPILAAHRLQLELQHLERARQFMQTAQHVQTHDVAGALPDAVHQHFTIQARQLALLAVTDAAQHLHRLGDERHALTANAVFGRRGQQPAVDQFAFIAAALPGAGKPEQQRGMPFQPQRHTRQDLAHQRLFYQQLAERLPLQRMIQRHRQPAAHQAVAAQRTVETGQAAHLQDMPHAVALIAQQPGRGVLKLHFAAGVGAVAQLVFQPLKANGVAAAVQQNARQEEVGQPAFGLRQNQVRIALRHREEPLVPHQPVGFARPARAERRGGGGIAQHVGAALFLRHAHADQQAALLPARQQVSVITIRQQRRQPGAKLGR